MLVEHEGSTATSGITLLQHVLLWQSLHASIVCSTARQVKSCECLQWQQA